MFWKPVKPIKETCFASGSTLHKYMENAFGIFPLKLVLVDVGVLKGIKACGYDELDTLISALQEHIILEVTAEW